MNEKEEAAAKAIVDILVGIQSRDALRKIEVDGEGDSPFILVHDFGGTPWVFATQTNPEGIAVAINMTITQARKVAAALNLMCNEHEAKMKEGGK